MDDSRGILSERLKRAQVLMGLGRLFSHVYHQLDVLSPCRVPRRGAAILISNHTSGLDPALIQAACPQRLITWLMAREYYENAWLNWGFRALGVIPVERSGKDLAATRAAMRALLHGHVLGIFPEGRIESDRHIVPFQQGVAMLAHRTRSPVFPAFLDGTQRGKDIAHACIWRQSASIRFGERVPLDYDNERPNLAESTILLETCVRRLSLRQ